MKKRIALLLVFVLAMTAFAGCGGGTDTATESEMVLRWNVGAEPKTIDPQLNSANEGGHVINNTFEGLMRDINGELIPGMAESYEVSEDGTIYTFHIREDVLWSDGEPVTANDFVYAWKRACDPKLEPEPSEYAYQLFYVKGAQDAFEEKGSLDDIAVTAIDEKTLQVELIAPTPYFLNLTTFYTYMPVRQDAVEQDPTGWAINPEIAVSNGPFVLTGYTTGDRLVLSKNENYWQADKVSVDRIEGTFIAEETTFFSAYEAGELDMIDDVPIQEIPRLKENNPDFYILPLVGTYYYIFNTEKAPFDDVKVRKAFTYAIDRTAVTEKITQGGEQPANGFVPPGLVDANGDEFRTVAGDFGIDPGLGNLEEAKALLEEAGYPNGEGFPEIEFITNTNEAHLAVAEAIQEMFKNNLGINMTITNQEWAVFQDTRHNGAFLLARGGWLGDYADPMTMLDLWLSYGGNNDAQWNSPEYDALIEESKVTGGQDRFQLLYDAEALLMEDMIVAPIYYYTDTVMIKDYVKGFTRTKMGQWWFGDITVETAE